MSFNTDRLKELEQIRDDADIAISATADAYYEAWDDYIKLDSIYNDSWDDYDSNWNVYTGARDDYNDAKDVYEDACHAIRAFTRNSNVL